MAKDSKGDMREYVKIDFSTFLYSLGTAALMSMGVFPDPITKKIRKNLEEARQNIDVIELIEEKTKGNLSKEEDRILAAILNEVRGKYVEAAKSEVIKV